jgi:hypothetical protein
MLDSTRLPLRFLNMNILSVGADCRADPIGALPPLPGVGSQPRVRHEEFDDKFAVVRPAELERLEDPGPGAASLDISASAGAAIGPGGHSSSCPPPDQGDPDLGVSAGPRLLAHPRALSSMPGRTPQRWDLSQIPDDLYAWMITGKRSRSGSRLCLPWLRSLGAASPWLLRVVLRGHSRSQQWSSARG